MERKTDPITRFWKYVDKNGPIIRPELGRCWMWTGGKIKKGYGLFYNGEKMVLAHRFAYELTNGAIPPGLCGLHDCDNPGCVRHVHVGTIRDNYNECVQRGRLRPARGEANAMTTLTSDDVMAIRSSNMRHRKIAERYGITKCSVGYIRRGVRWGHLPLVNSIAEVSA